MRNQTTREKPEYTNQSLTEMGIKAIFTLICILLPLTGAITLIASDSGLNATISGVAIALLVTAEAAFAICYAVEGRSDNG